LGGFLDLELTYTSSTNIAVMMACEATTALQQVINSRHSSQPMSSPFTLSFGVVPTPLIERSRFCATKQRDIETELPRNHERLPVVPGQVDVETEAHNEGDIGKGPERDEQDNKVPIYPELCRREVGSPERRPQEERSLAGVRVGCIVPPVVLHHDVHKRQHGRSVEARSRRGGEDE